MTDSRKPVVSVVVCTHNGLRRLTGLLADLGQQESSTPAWELIVVDNGSTNGSPLSAETLAGLIHAPLRLIVSDVKGKSRALNAGIAASLGQVILSTDDDVRVPPRWIQAMAAPILGGSLDAVVGCIRIAPHLYPDWMKGDWAAHFASTVLYTEQTHELIGASMGFSRKVLDRVPAFDPELGPGRKGLYEDLLFGYQLKAAGFRLGFLPNICAEHHFEAARLKAEKLCQLSAVFGTSRAYVDYHWHHASAENAIRHWLGWIKAKIVIAVRELLSSSDGAPVSADMRSVLINLAYWKEMMSMSGKSRNYSLHGLVKINGER